MEPVRSSHVSEASEHASKCTETMLFNSPAIRHIQFYSYLHKKEAGNLILREEPNLFQ